MRTAVVVTMALGAMLASQDAYTPARYAAGTPPRLAPMAVGGGQAIVELTVDAGGNVTGAATLRSTPPFTQLLADSVGGWQFTPATELPIGRDGKPREPRNVESRVIVAAMYRAPTLVGPTHGASPTNVAAATPAVAFPTSMREPAYPPQALGGGVVLIEAHVAATGAVTDAAVVGSAPPFDDVALQAARQWHFRPARVNGRAVASYAYIVFGFQQPITLR